LDNSIKISKLGGIFVPGQQQKLILTFLFLNTFSNPSLTDERKTEPIYFKLN
jgi:hypothetical protein